MTYTVEGTYKDGGGSYSVKVYATSAIEAIVAAQATAYVGLGNCGESFDVLHEACWPLIVSALTPVSA